MSVTTTILHFIYLTALLTLGRANKVYADECVIKGTFIVQQVEGRRSSSQFNVHIGAPIDGIFFNNFFLDEVAVDKRTRRFERKVMLQQPAVVPISVNGETYCLYAEPGEIVDLRVEVQNNKVIQVRDVGSLAVENNFLMTKLRQERVQYRNLTRKAQEFATSSEKDQLLFLDNCRMYLDKYLGSLDSLGRSNILSESFKPLARAQLTYHALALPLDQLVFWPKPTAYNTVRYYQVLDSLFAWVGDLDSTKFGVDNYLYWRAFNEVRYPISQDAEELSAFGWFSKRVVLPEPFDRWAIFSEMVFQYRRGFPTVSYRQAFETYGEHFSKDGFYDKLDSLNRIIVDQPIRYTDSDVGLMDSMRNYKFYIENGRATVGYFEDFDSFEHLLSTSSQGKPLFIDFWATWCEPCVSEFKYNKQLVDSLEKRGIGIAYVSIDHRDHRHQWENVARSYQLEGCHILLSEKLYKQVQKQLGLRGIPRYMFTMADGTVLLPDLGRPSEMGSLLEEIDTVFQRSTD